MRVAFALIGSEESKTLIRTSLQDRFEIQFVERFDEMALGLARNQVELVFIDIGFGLVQACQFCELLRRDPRTKSTLTVFLSSSRNTADLVRAFESGADDLLLMPFAPEELRARIDAYFRRQQVRQAIQDPFWRGDLRFSLGTQRVLRLDQGTEVDLELTPNEFKILYLLVRNENQTLTRKTILTEVWGENLHVVERTVDKHICSLRRKMGRRAHFVASVPGAGYQFSVSELEPIPDHANNHALEGAKVSV